MWLGLLIVVIVLAFGLAMIALVAAAIIAGLVAVATFLMPWLLIVAGAWLLARALRDPDRRGRRREAPPHQAPRQRPPHRQEQRQPAPPPPASPRGAASQRPVLPIDVQVKADQIRRKADVLVGYADRFSPFSHDLYIVRQMAADYLPRTIEAYLAVPGVGNPAFGPGAARALEELKSQLQLLDSKLDEIAVDLQRSDLNRLLANRRFLEERFGARDRDSELTVLRRGSGAA